MVKKDKLYKILPSYVGSKSFWVKELLEFKNCHFVELFCGSAVLSLNLASECVLNDIDPYVYKIISQFNEQIVPEVFTSEQYFNVRGLEDWWRYSFCLTKMSFSGVFRYSKNGFNVPIKPISEIYPRNDYLKSLERYNDLSPIVLNNQYFDCQEYIREDSILIIDPPYEHAQASYNSTFDYHYFWEYVRLNENICKTIILFEHVENMPLEPSKTRKTRVNGARAGNNEGMFIFSNSLKEGQKGEDLFYEINHDILNREDGFKYDFSFKSSGKKIELKSDYYDSTRTENFFLERYSDFDKKIDGGAWQSLKNNVDYYCYFYIKNKELYVFDVKKLVEFLERICSEKDLIFIPNKNYRTAGYKINRDYLSSIVIQRKIY